MPKMATWSPGNMVYGRSAACRVRFNVPVGGSVGVIGRVLARSRGVAKYQPLGHSLPGGHRMAAPSKNQVADH